MVEASEIQDIHLGDPLSEVTRKERRTLLASSMIGIIIVKIGLVPTKITALGIEFAETNQEALLSILGLIVLYFVSAFLIYSSADFLAWRKFIRKRAIDRELERFEQLRVDPESMDAQRNVAQRFSGSGMYLYSLTRPVSLLRAAFEFVLPLIVGMYASYILFTSTVTNT